jgi:ferredoxin
MLYAVDLGPAGAKRGSNSGASRHVGAECSSAAKAVRSPSSTAARCGRCSELYLPGCEETHVAYIICEPCIGTKDAACVDVCPVDCIHPRKDESAFAAAEMLYIHPDECIDCGACVPACPVQAIFALDETPENWENFILTNAQYYQK